MHSHTHIQWLKWALWAADVAIEVEVMKCSQKKQQRQLQQPKENATKGKFLQLLLLLWICIPKLKLKISTLAFWRCCC